MSLKYGLNVKKKAPAAPARRVLFDDGDDEEDDGLDKSENASTAINEVSSLPGRGSAQSAPSFASKAKSSRGPPTRAPENLGDTGSRQDQSSLRAAAAKVKAAEDVDSSIFDYDSFHDAKTSVTEAKKAADRQDAIERKPKYINNLLDAAARRKQDQQVAREKFLQREREAEGDEFADKEKFVTGAYKQQQEETRRLEEEEKRRTEEDEQRRRRLGGSGMQGFYRNMIDESERQHREAMEVTAKLEREGGARGGPDSTPEQRAKTDADLAAEMRAQGVDVHLNDEGQITDRRQLLSAGLNVGGPGRGGGASSDRHAADHLKTSNRGRESAFASRAGEGRNANQQAAQRERQTRMLEEQLADRAKRAREEEEAERARMEKAAKSSKTEKDVSDARARFLARKAAKERGEG